MNWIQRKIYLYNVTFGLYMLDWIGTRIFLLAMTSMLYLIENSRLFKRIVFFQCHCQDTLVIVLLWFMLYNTSRYVTTLCKSMHGEAHHEGAKWAWQFGRTDRHHRT